jgi:hypothetical protein
LKRLLFILIFVFLCYNVFAGVSITNLNLTSTSGYNLTTDNLTCNYNLNDSANTTAIAWYKNNYPQMLLYLPFEGNSTNALKDYSGYGNNATNVGGNWIYGLGYNGFGAYNFTTADSYVRVPAMNLRSNNVTIMAWVKGTGNEDFAGIIFSRSGNTIAGLNYHSSGLRYHWNDEGDTWGFNSGLIIPNNVWTFIALVITPNNATLFVNNNSVVNNFANSIEEFNGNTSIGDDTGFAGRYWIGGIDEVKILNYSMSREQVLAIYNNQSNIIVSSDIQLNDNWYCKVTPFSSLMSGTTYTSNNVTIISFAVTNVILNSTFGTNLVTENLTCNYNNVGNVSGDIITWYKNNTPLMLLYMPFEGNSTNALQDYSGNANSVIYSNATWNSTGGQKNTGGFYFNSSSYINVSNSASLNSSVNISVSVWVKGTAQGNFKYIVSKNANSDHSSYNLYTGNAGGIIFVVGWGTSAGQYTLSADGGNIWNNNWRHVVGTYDGSNIKLYIDGVQSGANVAETRKINYTTANLYVGSFDGSSGFNFNGTIDDVRIYNYSLSPQQILSLYNNRTDLIVSQELTVGDTWQCRVTPFSSTQIGTTVNSNIVTIVSQLCDIYVNTIFTNTILICDVFNIWNAVDVVFNNSTLTQNRTNAVYGFAIYLINGGQYA